VSFVRVDDGWLLDDEVFLPESLDVDGILVRFDVLADKTIVAEVDADLPHEVLTRISSEALRRLGATTTRTRYPKRVG